MKNGNNVFIKARVSGRFLVRMVLLFMLFSIIDSSQLVVPQWQDLTLRIVSESMGIMGMVVKVSGSYISTSVKGEPFGFFIDWDCTGWKSMFLFLSLVLSSATDVANAFKSFIFLPVLYILNIARILGVLAIISVYGASAFDAVHGIAFGYVSTLYTLASWVAWMRMVKNGS